MDIHFHMHIDEKGSSSPESVAAAAQKAMAKGAASIIRLTALDPDDDCIIVDGRKYKPVA